jgi:hypothetical protein
VGAVDCVNVFETPSRSDAEHGKTGGSALSESQNAMISGVIAAGVVSLLAPATAAALANRSADICLTSCQFRKIGMACMASATSVC